MDAIVDAAFARHEEAVRADAAQKLMESLASMEDSKKTIGERLTHLAAKVRASPTMNYSGTTWGFRPLKQEEVEAALNCVFHPVRFRVSFWASRESEYIGVTPVTTPTGDDL